MDIASWLYVIGRFAADVLGKNPSSKEIHDFLWEIKSAKADDVREKSELSEVIVDEDTGGFSEARDMWVASWENALKEVDALVLAGYEWDECIDELRICENGFRPVKEGYYHDDCYYASLADLLMRVPYAEYLESYFAEGGDSYYTQWESYCDID